jgi:hypothetical protein
MLRVIRSANQTISISLHRKWNHKKYCIPTSIVKLNIRETCASSLFFLFHFTGMNHNNAWPGTASIYIYYTWKNKYLTSESILRLFFKKHARIRLQRCVKIVKIAEAIGEQLSEI